MRAIPLVVAVTLTAAVVAAAPRASARPPRVPCHEGTLAAPLAGVACDVDEVRNRHCAFAADCPPCWPRFCRVHCSGAIVRVGRRRVVRFPALGRVLVLRCLPPSTR